MRVLQREAGLAAFFQKNSKETSAAPRERSADRNTGVQHMGLAFPLGPALEGEQGEQGEGTAVIGLQPWALRTLGAANCLQEGGLLAAVEAPNGPNVCTYAYPHARREIGANGKSSAHSKCSPRVSTI